MKGIFALGSNVKSEITDVVLVPHTRARSLDFVELGGFFL